MKPEELEYNGEYLTPESAIKWMLSGNECLIKTVFEGRQYYTAFFDGERFTTKEGEDFSFFGKLKPILSDPHANIKAEYEQAVDDGKIVKRFYKVFDTFKIVLPEDDKWYAENKYKLVYYRIDMSKLLSWSYSFGEGKEKLVKIDDGDTRDNIRFMKYVHYDFKPVISNMKLAVYNNETQQEELVDIPDFCLVKIEKDMC